jgi:hypothetical protein
MNADLIGDVADADVLSAELDEFVNGVLECIGQFLIF